MKSLLKWCQSALSAASLRCQLSGLDRKLDGIARKTARANAGIKSALIAAERERQTAKAVVAKQRVKLDEQERLIDAHYSKTDELLHQNQLTIRSLEEGLDAMREQLETKGLTVDNLIQSHQVVTTHYEALQSAFAARSVISNARDEMP